MTVRAVCENILEEVLEKDGQSHRLLQQAFRTHPELTARDRRFVTRLVRGTLEELLLLDERLALLMKLPVRKLKPYIRTLLRLSLYQLFFMEDVPASAVCNEAVKLVKASPYRDLAGFVNGVLRSAARREAWPEPSEAARCRMPQELLSLLQQYWGRADAERMCMHFLQPSPLTVRINPARTDAAAVRAAFEAGGMLCGEIPGLPEVLSLQAQKDPAGEEAVPFEQQTPFRDGLVQVQDISSVLAVRAADPGAGMQVLDLCAAPGGKCLHAAQLIAAAEKDCAVPVRGSVLACDLTERKVSLIRENIARCGADNIRTEAADAAVFRPEREGKYDLVIADLPCSGLGVIGRKPEIRYRVTGAQIRELAALQRSILQNAVRYVKPGGLLLFSTCTVTKEENEENAAYLRGLPCLEPVDFSDRMPEYLRQYIREQTLQLLPGREDTDGFFICLMRRKQTSGEK